ncbi:electron transfer flavoprotein subunit alpha/FixB family protein [Polycladidibacter stylochi]|uniref:electron transfer flavoprotein subunit alpha/FixB family protein n=1 Tax=Polycladidibacter stylochi TaxID=1807766 RepID=UPI00082E5FD2|nr:electron transfer flavoprotein subunit alpha/FixB family protein [Pseudovibrio stylochi]
MHRALVYFEKENCQHAVQLLEVLRQLYGNEAFECYALTINGNGQVCQGKVDYVLDVQNQALKPYDQRALTDVVSTLCKTYDFDHLLFVASHFGRTLAPRVAIRLGAAFVSEITAVRHDADSQPQFIAPEAGVQNIGVIKAKAGKPVVLTVRPDTFQYDGSQEKTTKQIKLSDLEFKAGGIRQISRHDNVDNNDISDCELLISGGGGIAKHFEALAPLAKALRGKVSASRPILDRDLIPRSALVGQSGKTVSPRLYMALGIHGAIQHVVALERVEHIISVNTNVNAPICSLSEIVVHGDAATFVDKMLKKIMEDNSHATD